MAGSNQLLDDTFIALADPTRRAILRRLAKSEARITELAAWGEKTSRTQTS